MTKLIVKNFGVLKDIDINLNKTNLFIGENGVGKSVLAKLITIITDITLSEDKIFKKFKDYNIDFINDDTIIKFTEKEDVIFELKNQKIKLMESSVALAQLYPILEPAIKLEKNKIKQDKELLGRYATTQNTFGVFSTIQQSKTGDTAVRSVGYKI